MGADQRNRRAPATLEGLRGPTDQDLDLGAILHQAQVAVTVRDLSHRLTYWNLGAQRLYGWSSVQATGRVMHELLSTSFPGGLEAIEAELKETGLWQGELTHIGSQGRAVVVESNWILRRDQSGRPGGILTLELDRTRRHQAELALRESEERYRRLFEDDLTGDYLADDRGQILACNSAFLKLFGLASQQQARAVNLASLHDPPEEFAAFVDQVRQKGKLEQHPCQRRRHDGSSFHGMENVVGEFDHKGCLVGLKGYIYDDTDRFMAELALRQSEERYRRLFEEDLTGDYLADPHGRILACNPAFLKLFGLVSQEEALTTNLASFYPRPEEFDSLRKLIRRDGRLEHYQCQRRRQDGSLFHAVENVVAEFGDQGEMVAIKGYLFDDTARKQGEEALLRKDREITLQLKKIEKLNAALTTLLERREQESRQKEEDILATVEQLVLPHLQALLSTRLDDDQRLHIEVVAGNLKNVTSTFARRLATWKTKLTPAEIRVADLIRQGKGSKEIAALLRISTHAVAFHRANLRDKLGLKGQGGNLAAYLSHLT